MDPSRCMNENVYRTTLVDNYPRNVSCINHLKERLATAAKLAENQLISKASDIPETIVISNETRRSIIVDEVSIRDGGTEKTYFVVYCGPPGVTAEQRIKVPNEKFRHIYFENLVDCRIFVKCKLLRIMFKNVSNSQISIRSPVIGLAEFYKCDSSNLFIRIPSHVNVDDINPPIPVTTIENCKQFSIFQSVDTLVYLVKLCIDVSGTIVDLSSGARIANYNLGKMFWNENERMLVCLSKSEGFAAVPMQYVLNDLEQHVIIRPPESEIDERDKPQSLPPTDVNSLFGTTPPVHNEFWKMDKK